MPPLYPPFPWTFRGAQISIIQIRLDEVELQAALPDGFTVLTDRAVAWNLTCPAIAGVGRYSEFMINAAAMYDGQKVSTTPFIYVDNDAAMAAGRELLSLDKRLATFDRRLVGEQESTDVTRSGVTFASFGMTWEREGSSEDVARYQSWLSHPATNGYTSGVVQSWVTPRVSRVVHGHGYIDLRPSAADRLHQLKARASSAVRVEADLVMEAPHMMSAKTPGHDEQSTADRATQGTR